MEEGQYKEITIAFGNQTALTKNYKTQKEIFIKIAPAFREKQLRELKGALLSVFICYALHGDEYGYTWADDKTIKKETGYTITTEIRQKLIGKGYLYQARLRNRRGQVRDYIYRIFQPIEEGKKFIIRGEELYTPVKEKPCFKENPESGKDGGIIEEEPMIPEEKPISPNGDRQKPASYGNEDINYLMGKFRELTGLNKLDNSQKQNRRYCWLCLQKFGSKENTEALIGVAMQDKFHQANLTSFKYLYYNGVKILNQLKVGLEHPRLLDLTKLKK